jgi:hypothetical protein
VGLRSAKPLLLLLLLLLLFVLHLLQFVLQAGNLLTHGLLQLGLQDSSTRKG